MFIWNQTDRLFEEEVVGEGESWREMLNHTEMHSIFTHVVNGWSFPSQKHLLIWIKQMGTGTLVEMLEHYTAPLSLQEIHIAKSSQHSLKVKKTPTEWESTWKTIHSWNRSLGKQKNRHASSIRLFLILSMFSRPKGLRFIQHLTLASTWKDKWGRLINTRQEINAENNARVNSHTQI